MLENRTGAMSMQGVLHLMGKNPGELEQELGGLQAQYAFEVAHPSVACYAVN